MQAKAIPKAGDIVIRETTQDGMVVYVLRLAAGPDQFLCHTRDEAVADAVLLAKRESVRAWVTDKGNHIVLLEDFRKAERV